MYLILAHDNLTDTKVTMDTVARVYRTERGGLKTPWKTIDEIEDVVLLKQKLGAKFSDDFVNAVVQRACLHRSFDMVLCYYEKVIRPFFLVEQAKPIVYGPLLKDIPPEFRWNDKWIVTTDNQKFWLAVETPGREKYSHRIILSLKS